MKARDKAKEKARWGGLTDGPWPTVEVNGELENAEEEWLHTSGTGAYCMSTVALMHTRRDHGVLVARLGETARRHVILSHVETIVEVDGKSYRTSTHQFPNVAPTPGYRQLQTFAQDPLPRWVFRIGKGTLERTISMVRGSDAVALGYTWSGKYPARLLLRPLMPMRPADVLTHEHGGMMQKVTLRSGEVEVQPVPELPSVMFRHSGVFMGSPDWWRQFEYLSDRERYDQFQEDIWCPGVFEMILEPRQTQYLVAGMGHLPTAPPAQLVMEAAQHVLNQDPGQGHSRAVRALSVAAEHYVREPDGCLIAGFPWLDVWTRDALLCVPGIHLSRGYVDRAKACLSRLIQSLEGDLLPRRLVSATGGFDPAVDATLWLFEIGRRVVDATGTDDPFVRETLFPALVRVFERVRAPATEHEHVWLTPDGLLENGAAGKALTWMDAGSGGQLLTPRRGLAVELQALWAAACTTLAALSHTLGEVAYVERAQHAAHAITAAFRERFWCNETNYPFDCVSASADVGEAWVDPSVRPNALIALSVAPALFDQDQRQAILRRVERDLLTSRGLRSLAPHNLDYVAHAVGDATERQHALHQGSAWPYLLPFYVRSSLLIDGNEPDNVDRLRGIVEQALDGGLVLGHVPQTSDGDPPHRWRGSPAQAFSVGMLLDVLRNELAGPPESG